MSNTIVVYESKYGSTKQYAEWLAEDLNCDIFNGASIKLDNLKKYDTIIYGAGLYAGHLSGLGLITKSFEKLEDKNLVIFTCGLANPKDEDNIKNINSILQKTISLNLVKRIKFFYLRGGMDYSKLGIIDKTLMWVLLWVLYKTTCKKDPATLTNEEKEIIDTYGKKIKHLLDRNNIDPIVDYVNKEKD